MNIIVPSNISPLVCLDSVVCEELSRLPFDDPTPLVVDSELIRGLNLSYHFNRKYPLVKYSVSFSSRLNQEDTGKQIAVPSKLNNIPKTSDNDISVRIQNSQGFSALLTGKTPIAQFPLPDEVGQKNTVFVVPREESNDYLSLLPDESRRPLTNSKQLRDAALYLALSYRKKSFLPVLDIQLKQTRSLDEEGKSFRKFLNDCVPEIELKTMLQDPETKLCPFLKTSHFQLNWYRKHCDKRGPFADLESSISIEEGRQYERLVLLRNSLAWAHFIKNFPASVYILSAEDMKQLCNLKMHIINGIIIANSWNKNNCCIVITGSLQLPLDQIIQRDVRKLVFPEQESSPLVRIGFLEKHQTKPFFEVSTRMHQTNQQQSSSYHTVYIDATKPDDVHCIGNEPILHLIRDRMDIMLEICSTLSNKILGLMKYYPKKPASNKLSKPTHLDDYMKCIGYKHSLGSSEKVASILCCLVGPVLVQQLRNATSKDIEQSGIQVPGGLIPDLLEANVSGSTTASFFVLTPSKCSASAAEVVVKIPREKPIQVRGKTVLSAKFIVSRARTLEPVQIGLALTLASKSKPLFLDVDLSKYLCIKRSHGVTIGDHMHSVCSNNEAWIDAKNCTVGEIMHIFLGNEKATTAIQSLPLFLSFPLMKTKIVHYLTSILVDYSTNVLKEAHISANSFEITHVAKCGKLQVTSLSMHIFQSHNEAEQPLIVMEGEVSAFGMLNLKLSCSSTQDSHKRVECSFTNSLSPAKVFELFQLNISPKPTDVGLNDPIKLPAMIAYKCGFIISQLLENTLESQLTALFFNVEYINGIDNFLPSAFNSVKKFNARVVVHLLSLRSTMLGLEASFIKEFELANEDKMTLECKLQICPSTADGTYSYSLNIQPYLDQEGLCGESSIDIIKVLDKTLGNDITVNIAGIPQIGIQILKNMLLKKIILKIHKCQILLIDLRVTLSKLELIPGKLSVTECSLKISYSREQGLQLHCCGRLCILKHRAYVEFSLPTLNQRGHICFDGSKKLILKLFLEEFGWISFLQSKPILKEVLDIALEKVALDLEVTESPNGKKFQIARSEVCLSKELLDIGLLKFQNITLNLSTRLVDGQCSVTFTLGAFVSDSLYAQLDYSDESKTLSGLVKVEFAKSVSAIDIFHLFQVPVPSYESMRAIFKEEFLDIFGSSLKITLTPGLTASMYVSISVPSKQSKKFSLQQFNLEVKDALKISCKKKYLLSAFQFNYNGISGSNHLHLAVHKLNTREDMTLDFELPSCQAQGKTLNVTAKVAKGPHGGFLKLGSAIDLAETTNPEIPDFAKLPSVFDTELLSGSVTFNLKPFKPSAFYIAILIQEWQIFDDPHLKLHKVLLRAEWESGTLPQFTFSDCSLEFIGHTFSLKGSLSPEKVHINCVRKSAEINKPKPVKFQNMLDDCSPKSAQSHPTVPTDIGLPSLDVNLKELDRVGGSNFELVRLLVLGGALAPPPLGGSGGMLPRKILKKWCLETHSPAF